MAHAAEPGSPDAHDAKPRAVRIRAVLWGFGLSVPVCYWNAWQPVDTLYSLLFSTMAALIALVACNALLHRFAPRLALTTADLIIAFGIASVASAISAEWTFLNMQYVHVFAGYQEREPLYKDVILKYVPEQFYFKDPDLVRDYVAGGQSRTYFLSRLDIWLPKVAMWTLLYGMITVALLCINSLMRDAWLRRERLSYPIIQLPLAMVEEDGRGPLWKNRAMWIAFAIMFSIDILNGLNYLFPNLPSVPVKIWVDLGDFVPEQPWNSIGFTPLSLYPFLAALGLFMPSDLLFSVIFFFIVRKLILVVVAYYGLEHGSFGGGFLIPEKPYFTEQTWGAVIGLFATAMWVSRSYLREVWGEIRSGVRARDGGLPHRWSFLLLCVCVAGVLYFLSASGLPIVVLIPYILVFFAFSIVVSRMRAQLGPPTHEFAFFGPNQLLMNFYGTSNIPEKASTLLGTVFLGINRLSRSHPMPVQLEAMKLADTQRLHQGAVFGLLSAALFIGAFLGAIFMIQRGYVRGAEAGWGDPVAIVRGVKESNAGPNFTGMSMVFLGFCVVTVLDVLRFRFPGFTLHPVGYALSLNFGVDYYWFGLVIALFVKTLVQRYYGLKGYKQLRNVAFGILIAEYSAELIWATMAIVTRQSTYTVGFNERGVGEQ